MSKLRLYGDTSGYVELEAPAVASNEALVLPASGSLATEAYVGAEIGGLALGKVLQVVQNVRTSRMSTTSTSYVNFMSASITPSSTNSKILIVSNVSGNISTQFGSAVGSFFRGNSEIYIGDASDSRTRSSVNFSLGADSSRFAANSSISFIDEPNSTSLVTYEWKVRLTSATQGVRLFMNSNYNPDNSASSAVVPSSIVLMEIGE
jgi:hypothetical protein